MKTVDSAWVGNLKVVPGQRYAIVYSRFNQTIVEGLVQGAVQCLAHHGAADEQVELIEVPGAWELPLTVARLAKSSRFNAIIALGAVIRGGTPHFEYVAGEASSGLMRAQLDSLVPVAFGLLTTDNVEQAEERSGQGRNNKGWDAALTVVEALSLEKILADNGC
ncbi:MAG: 6,7-dimethyl-8-ribityllumazine synthase [Polyangiales bacterium]